MRRNEEHDFIARVLMLSILKDLAEYGDAREEWYFRNGFRIDVPQQSAQHDRLVVLNAQRRVHFAVRDHGVTADKTLDRAVFGMHFSCCTAVGSNRRCKPKFYAHIDELYLLAS